MLSDERKNPFELLPGNKGLQNKLLSGPRSPSFKGRHSTNCGLAAPPLADTAGSELLLGAWDVF